MVGISAGSWLDLYLKYTEVQESPDLFHLWTGITLVGAAMGRKCWMRRIRYLLYPNIFCVLVAGSGKCRKSTAIEIGVTNILQQTKAVTDPAPTIKVFDGKITPEQFTKEMAAAVSTVDGKKVAPSTLVWADELAVFLTKQSYGEPMIHILTRLFGCPEKWSYKTKNRGVDELYNTFICIIAATTPDGVAKGIPESALQEGFAARVIWVYQPTTDRELLFHEESAEERELLVELQVKLQEISEMQGEFALTPDAKEWCEAWYHAHRQTIPSDPRLEGMHDRKHDHLFRLGMIYAGAERTFSIDPGHCDAALMILDSVMELAPGAFAKMTSADVAHHIDRARTFMMRFGRMHHSALVRRMYPCDAEILNKKVFPTLMQSGQMIEDPKNHRIYIWKG